MWARQAQLTLELVMNLMLRKGLVRWAAPVVRAVEMFSHALHPLLYRLLHCCMGLQYSLEESWFTPSSTFNLHLIPSLVHPVLPLTNPSWDLLLPQVLIQFSKNFSLCKESNPSRKTWAKSTKRRRHASKETLLVITAPSQDQQNSAALSSSYCSVMDQWGMGLADKNTCDWSMDYLMDFYVSMSFSNSFYVLSSALSLFQNGLLRLLCY